MYMQNECYTAAINIFFIKHEFLYLINYLLPWEYNTICFFKGYWVLILPPVTGNFCPSVEKNAVYLKLQKNKMPR